MKHEPVQPTINTRRLTLLYILALGMVGLLTIVGQFAVQLSLARLQSDARIVNLAGRQRMLSQRLPLLVYTFQYNDRVQLEESTREKGLGVSKDVLIQELRSLLNTWEESHRGLQSGSAALGLPGKNSPEVADAFREIETHFQVLQTTVNKYAKTSQADEASTTLTLDQHLDLVQHSQGFLAGMDRIVSLYESEANARVSRLKAVERSLLVATLFVLVLEGLFIFSPAISSLRRAFDQLTSTSEQLAHAKQLAEAANRAKTEFLTRVSHELRTPLHGILGMLNLVKKTSLNKSQRRSIHLANQASKTLQRLVDDLLDVAGIEAGKLLPLRESVVDLYKLVTGVVELMAPAAERKELKISVRIEPNVPRWTKVDSDRLRQALLNLIQNAIRYTDQGEVQCCVMLESQFAAHGLASDTSMVVFQVADTGRGIAHEDQARIFESFVRVSGANQPQDFGPGLGLGLPITVALIRQMNGNVVLKSEPQKGTTVQVILPIQRSEKPAVDRIDRSIAKVAFHRNARRTKVLVVDDSRINRVLMKEFLKRLKCRPKSASSLAVAAKIIRHSSPDILLLDQQLPDGDGLSFVRDLSRTLPNLPTIFLVTADIHLGHTRVLPSDPIAGILHKPLSLLQLQHSLQPHIANIAFDQEVVVQGESELDEVRRLKSYLLEALQKRLPEEIAELREYRRLQDFRMIQLAAHRLKGSSSNVDWGELAQCANRLEEAAVQHDVQAIDRAYECLLALIGGQAD